MALKKSQIYASLWQSCDELRGGMDASQYKDYILTLLFMKYVSDKYADEPFAVIDVPDGGGFADMVKLKGDKEIGDKINKIIARFAESNDLKDVINQADFNDESKLGAGKEMQDRLSKLVAIFENLDFRANRTEGDDLLGDAYEYLMRHFATESGKSKGQFYTPAEVSRIMAKVIGIGADTRLQQTISDPTCGSGSLLLKAADEAPSEISVYGQEKDNATYALARMNMFLHDNPTAVIRHGNTLTDPLPNDQSNGLKTYDFAVANPPFSDKAWSNGLNPAHDEFRRFEYGVPPAKNGDYAFLLHFIASLNSKGKGAIILPHGVLFRGNKEADIRRQLVRRGVIKGIIGLPANLFYGTGIPACILVIDKENAQVRTGIFMIDASKGFLKDGNKNRLRAQDIHKIVDVFNKQTELPGYSRMAPVSEIADHANDYNLNIPRYIDASEPEDLHNLDAHLNGGIPDRDIDALDAYWTVFPTLRRALFKANGRPGYSDPNVETTQVKAAILNHAEFTAFQARVGASFNAWRDVHAPTLSDIEIGASPKEIIHALSEEMLRRFDETPLLNPYDLYQRLMDYWDETMGDDIYLIASDGWVKAAQPRDVIEDKNRKIKETPDLTLKHRKYKMDLIPPALIVARYFPAERASIETLQTRQEEAAGELQDFVEEHTGDEGLLLDAINDKGNVTMAGVKARLKQITPDLVNPLDEENTNEERDALERCLSLLESKAATDKVLKDAQLALDTVTLDRYATLTETEIKTLVVEDKWFGNLQAATEDEVQRLTQQLTGRVKELEERYAQPLPELEHEVEKYSTRVKRHLQKMELGLVSIQQLLTGETRLPGFTGVWQTQRLGNIATFSKGSGNLLKTDLSLDGKRRCIHYGELFTTYRECIRKVVHGTNREGLFSRSLRNDVLMPASDVTPNGLATASCILDSDVILGGDILVIRVPASVLNGVFLAYSIKINRNQVMSLVSGTTVYHLYGHDMANFCFAMPSLVEQNAIVRILGDIDAEIAALERRRNKTRAIKQGMMQELLNGRVRLVKSDAATV